MADQFRNIFLSERTVGRERAKFLSRVFGIFSEQIVNIWSEHENAPYENLGRPTIGSRDGRRGCTLDFTLRDRKNGRIYVSEMKCEIEFQNFKFFALRDVSQLKHHTKPAFAEFLRFTKPEVGDTCVVKGQRLSPDGAILVWGTIEPEGREVVMREFGFRDILAIDNICADLASWQCPKYKAFLDQRRTWCRQLFDGLTSFGEDL